MALSGKQSKKLCVVFAINKLIRTVAWQVYYKKTDAQSKICRYPRLVKPPPIIVAAL